MIFGSVCSGIEAASVAWRPLGWRAAWFSEIEPFPSAVLAHHYPGTPNLGDMTGIARRVITGEVEAPDVLCGGTPCQAFSVAGLRESLNDDRGNLTLTFCELADAIDFARTRVGHPPAIVFWENVPGVLSTRDNAFGCFLAGLAGEDGALKPPGGKWTNAGYVSGPARTVAWRTLDAQYFGLAQRRRRVFVVASARDDFDPAQVLFEWGGVRRDSAPSREAGEDSAGSTGDGIARYVTAGEGKRGDLETCNFVAQAFMADDYKDGGYEECDTARPLTTSADRTRAAPMIAFSGKDHGADAGEIAPTLRAMGHSGSHANGGGKVAVAFAIQAGALRTNPLSGPDGVGVQADHAYTLEARAEVQAVALGVTIHGTDPTVQRVARYDETAQCLRALTPGNIDNSSTTVVQHAMQVRRLTPRECERLQGFPDDYTLIPWRKKPASECPDGPRYKALGNSWAVPVVRWIGARIQLHIGRQETTA